MELTGGFSVKNWSRFHVPGSSDCSAKWSMGGGQKFGELALGEGRYFCIWRCQNKVEGPKYLGNIVEVSLDRFYRLGMQRFYL